MSIEAAVSALVAEHQRQPGVSLEELRQWPGYMTFIEELSAWDDASEEVGGMDSDYGERRPEWLCSASDIERRRWLFTLGRAERWQEDCSVVLDALKGGQLAAIAG